MGEVESRTEPDRGVGLEVIDQIAGVHYAKHDWELLGVVYAAEHIAAHNCRKRPEQH